MSLPLDHPYNTGRVAGYANSTVTLIFLPEYIQDDITPYEATLLTYLLMSAMVGRTYHRTELEGMYPTSVLRHIKIED